MKNVLKVHVFDFENYILSKSQWLWKLRRQASWGVGRQLSQGQMLCFTLHTCAWKITFHRNHIRTSPPPRQASWWVGRQLSQGQRALLYSSHLCSMIHSQASTYLLEFLVFIRPLNDTLLKKYTDENILKRITKLSTKFMIRIFYIIFAIVF